jgi:diadenosine tetraphosphate (Ap4A) HIT family hydrolase
MSMYGSCFQSLFRNAFDNVPDLPPATCVYHEPPPAEAAVVDYYSANPSVFGRILNGESPSRDYAETSELLAFRDRSPKAEFHALVIPKRYVPNLYSLTNDDLDLVRDMRRLALDLLEDRVPRARDANDYVLCFHVPPFNSVDHLHLHVLAPTSRMAWIHRYGKYRCGTRWCIEESEVIDRLSRGMAAVPYAKML